jgi:hypothetical protein
MDARQLLRASLPFVLDHITDKQLQQVQRVFDAAVINPEIEKDADDVDRRSILARSGSVFIRDPAMVRRADKIRSGLIPVNKMDQRIRLDLDALLESDALKPVTDNPDEAAYLQKVKATLKAEGVWLRFASKLVQDPEDRSRHYYDPRTFEAWLSLGPAGDTIPTKSGRLTREALLTTTRLGAGYYERVFLGPVQSALKKEVNRLTTEIESGLEQHQELAAIRRKAFPGVTEVSDTFGGANFPDQSIWEQPRRFVLRALDLNVGGNVKGSQAFLVSAAILTRNAAHLVASYIDDTSTGAERAVKLLKVARAAGHVAEVGLAVTGVVGLVRGGAALAGGAAATEGSVDALAEQVVKKYVAQNPEIAGDLGSVRWVKGPKGSIGGGIKPGHSSGLGGGGWGSW